MSTLTISTKEEKHNLIKELRQRWAQAVILAKKLRNEGHGFFRAWQETIAKTPNFGFENTVFIKLQMEEVGFKGMPVIDCKTFEAWGKAGYIVKKGEHSKIMGVTWESTIKRDIKAIRAGDAELAENTLRVPKIHWLFHRSQVTHF